MTEPPAVSVVVPTVGRPSLPVLLDALAASALAARARPLVVLVDDRVDASTRLVDRVPAALEGCVRVVRGRAAGPASARNLGWRSTSTPWVAFLDDDVVPPVEWFAELARDLASVEPGVGAVQGAIRVPRPSGRRLTDWERNVVGLERAAWATADLALRRSALQSVGGFDERFRGAYREDADLALRLMEAGWRLTRGRRHVAHPVRPAPWHVSVGLQRGNREDPWMWCRHGGSWRRRAEAPPGRRPWHLATVGAAVIGLAGTVSRRRAPSIWGAGAWALLTAELAWRRIAPGPGTRREVAAMVATSVALPFAATGWWLRGVADIGARHHRPAATPFPDAVLFDRDGTLVEDVPYNGDPGLVRLRPGAARAVAELRAWGIPVGLVTNQSGIGRGLIRRIDADAVNQRAALLLGGLDTVQVCEHRDGDGCGCRKPEPGLVLAASRALGAEPSRCVVIGDIGSDMGAAAAAGARGVLVPNGATRPEEVAAAVEVAPDLPTAVAMARGEVAP